MERFYCGNKNPVPPGYAGYDTRWNCLRKGVGVGLYRLRQGKSIPSAINDKYPPGFFTWRNLPWYVWILLTVLFIALIVFMILYWTKG